MMMLGHIAFIAVMVGLGLSLPFHAIGDVG